MSIERKWLNYHFHLPNKKKSRLEKAKRVEDKCEVKDVPRKQLTQKDVMNVEEKYEWGKPNSFKERNIKNKTKGVDKLMREKIVKHWMGKVSNGNSKVKKSITERKRILRWTMRKVYTYSYYIDSKQRISRREPWCTGFRRELNIKRLLVRIPSTHTRWIIFHNYLL